MDAAGRGDGEGGGFERELSGRLGKVKQRGQGEKAARQRKGEAHAGRRWEEIGRRNWGQMLSYEPEGGGRGASE